MTTTAPRPGGTARLGDHEVARIGFGTMQLEHAPEDRGLAVLRRARELGVDHLDTAQFYGEGTSNRLIGAALAPYGEDLVIVTKVGATRRDGELVLAQQPDDLRTQVEENLATLGVERLDVVNLRRADAGPGLIAEGEQVVPVEDQLAVLTDLRDQGKIGAIGLSNVSAEQLTAALPVGVVCVQNADSLLSAASHATYAVAREHDIAWVPYFPLGSAFPGLPKVTDDPVVREVADELGATAAQVGLVWLLDRYAGTLLIAGTSDPEHLAENLAAGDVVLTAEQRERLDAIAA